MMDMFEGKAVSPMLIGESGEAFDDPNFLFEFKLNGERCIAYLDPLVGTDLRNKLGVKMLVKVPELGNIHKQVDARCILDGELIVATDGEPNFNGIQRRSLASDKLKIYMLSSMAPATFVAFDILYYDGKETTSWTTVQRKELLERVVAENERLMVSRYVEEHGIDLNNLAASRNLEGVVAKRKESRYYPDRPTRDWIKIKNPQDDDFVVCGYIEKDKHVVNVVLGQYEGERLAYKGQVPLDVSTLDFRTLSLQKRASAPVYEMVPPGCENAVWLAPDLVCTVRHTESAPAEPVRQPVFKGFRMGKEPKECVASPVPAGIHSWP